MAHFEDEDDDENDGVSDQNSGVRMRAPATTFEDLVVWQKTHQFVLGVYRLSRTFPRSETYGLRTVLVEVSRLLEAYSQAILNSDS